MSKVARPWIPAIARLLIATVGLAITVAVLVIVAAAVLGDRAPSLPRAEVIEEWACEFADPVSVDTRSFLFPTDSADPPHCEITTGVRDAMNSPTAYLCLLDPGASIIRVEARVWIHPVAPVRSERCRLTTSDGEQLDVWEMTVAANPNLRPH